MQEFASTAPLASVFERMRLTAMASLLRLSQTGGHSNGSDAPEIKLCNLTAQTVYFA